MKFGTWFRNNSAGAANPHREGMYVQTIHRPHHVANPGIHYKLTDGRGDFWIIEPKYLVQIDAPAPAIKPGDTMVRVWHSGVVERVTVKTADAEWLTLAEEPGERYSAKTRLRERSWAMLVTHERYTRHALAEALLGIEATTVEEYRSRAHALAMNWKLEE